MPIECPICDTLNDDAAMECARCGRQLLTEAQLDETIRPIEGLEESSFLEDTKMEDSSTDWKIRFKENTDKMRSGSLLDVAAVMKNLLFLHKIKPLSPREKKIVERARYLLASEIAMAKNIDENAADSLLVKTMAKLQLTFPELTPDA